MHFQEVYLAVTRATLQAIKDHCRTIYTDWDKSDEFYYHVEWFVHLTNTL